MPKNSPQREAQIRQQRRQIARGLGAEGEILKGSLIERFTVCSRPGCLCLEGEKHGPYLYVSVFDGKQSRQVYVPRSMHAQVRHWVRNAQRLSDAVGMLSKLETALPTIPAQSAAREDRQFVLVTLAQLWQDQAQHRYRGKSVIIPERIQHQLQSRCANLSEVQTHLFRVMDQLHRASSGVERVNSRAGFYRYSKRRFSGDFANLIAVWHNLSPFEDGKRARQSPAQILNIKLPSYDLFEPFNVAA